MTVPESRYLFLGAAAGASLAALIAFAQPPGPVTSAGTIENHYNLTWSSDGRTVYMWRVSGTTVEYISTSRVPASQRAEQGPDPERR